MGFILILFGGLLVIFGAGIFRMLASRAFGVKSVRAAMGFDHAPFSSVSLIGRLAVALAGLLGAYLAVALLFAFALAIGGRVSVDEASMRVTAAPRGPAARAGIVDGDRITRVNDHVIVDWLTLKSEIAKRAGEDVAIEVEREGATRIVHVTPAGNEGHGKILVGPYMTHEPVGIGGAMASGLVMPTHIWQTSLLGLARIFSGNQQAELSGPVAYADRSSGSIVQETSAAAQNSTATGLMFAASIYAYFFFIAVILSIAFFPRRRRSAA